MARIDIEKLRREQIIEAAKKVILKKGFAETSFSALEEAAGVSRGVITYHFKNKEDILLSVFEQAASEYECWLCNPARLPHGRRPTLERLLGSALEAAEDEAGQQYLTILFNFLAQMPFRPQFRARLASIYAHGGEELERAAKKELNGKLPKPAVRRYALLLQALLIGLSYLRLVDPRRVPSDDARALLAWLNGMVRRDAGAGAARGD